MHPLQTTVKWLNIWKRLKLADLDNEKNSPNYCKPINIGGYLIRQILPLGHIDCYIIWLSFVVHSMRPIKGICIGGNLFGDF